MKINKIKQTKKDDEYIDVPKDEYNELIENIKRLKKENKQIKKWINGDIGIKKKINKGDNKLNGNKKN